VLVFVVLSRREVVIISSLKIKKGGSAGSLPSLSPFFFPSCFLLESCSLNFFTAKIRKRKERREKRKKGK
jgi:hypothetical protein